MTKTSTLSLRSILEKENIILSSNYLDWYKKVNIALRHERKNYVLENEQLKELVPNASEECQSYYSQYMENALDVQCIMLSSMSSELQRQHENMSAREIDQHLRELFQESARVERYKTSRALFRTMLMEGNQVEPHALKMIGYIKRLESLGSKLDQDLAVDLVLSSLPPSFFQFMLNFTMNSMDKSLTDLMAMVKTVENDMKVNPSKRAMKVIKTNKPPSTGKFNHKPNVVKNLEYHAQKNLKKWQQVPGLKRMMMCVSIVARKVTERKIATFS